MILLESAGPATGALCGALSEVCTDPDITQRRRLVLGDALLYWRPRKSCPNLMRAVPELTAGRASLPWNANQSGPRERRRAALGLHGTPPQWRMSRQRATCPRQVPGARHSVPVVLGLERPATQGT